MTLLFISHSNVRTETFAKVKRSFSRFSSESTMQVLLAYLNMLGTDGNRNIGSPCEVLDLLLLAYLPNILGKYIRKSELSFKTLERGILPKLKKSKQQLYTYGFLKI